MHHRNAVSVVASENCDTRVLEKMDFEDLCIGKREREINYKNIHVIIVSFLTCYINLFFLIFFFF